jgi:hypothetical protein
MPFHDTFNLKWDRNEILEAFVEELTVREMSCAYFQQDTAPAHIT